MMSIERSGVRTWTVPWMSSHWLATARSVASWSVVRPRRMRSTAAVAPSASPSSTRTWVVAPSASSKLVWRAAHGSMPAPTAPSSLCPRSRPAGRSGAPLRPRNSVRSAVHAVCRPPRSRNATRPPNSVFHGLRIRSACVSGSSAVTIWGRWPRARCPAPTPRRRSRTGAWSARIGSRSSAPRPSAGRRAGRTGRG